MYVKDLIHKSYPGSVNSLSLKLKGRSVVENGVYKLQYWELRTSKFCRAKAEVGPMSHASERIELIGC